MNEILKINNRTISIPLFNIVKDIQNGVHNGKLQIVKSPVADNIRVQCVNSDHKGGHESRPSASIYIGPTTDKVSYGTYSCFTCGMVCSFEHFVAMAFDESDAWAKQWLIDNYADDDISSPIIQLDPIILNKKVEKKSKIDLKYLDTLESYHPYMTKRKLTKDIIEKFKVKYEPMSQCLVFPVEDERGSLTLLTRRSVIDKTFIIDKNVEKPLYLLGELMRNNITTALITEGQIDALTSWVYGMPAIATMGAVSDHQIKLLQKSGIRVLYLMFDNDEAGRRFTNKIINNIKSGMLVIPVNISIYGKKDINDLNYEEFWQCVNNSRKNLVYNNEKF